MAAAGTLAAWPEARVRRAMRAWRRGAGALEPWFRATPFASALHYRDRALAVRVPAVRAPAVETDVAPRAADRLLRLLPAPRRDTLWIFDLPGPIGLRLACALRRRLRIAAALPWNGWYDPRGLLDGRAEIPLLLGLGPRLERLDSRGACLLLEAGRRPRRTGPGRLDNGYTLGEEDLPAIADLRRAGFERVRAWTWRAPAPDLAAYLEHLAGALDVTVVSGVERIVRNREKA